jgi:hypothetical protein
MSNLLLRTRNSPDSNIFYYKSRISGETTSFWVQQGAIAIRDEQTGKTRYISRREFLVLGKTMEDLMKNTSYHDEKADLRGMLACMAIVARNAKNHANPFASSTDPALLAKMLGSQSKRLKQHPKFGTMLRIDE